MILIRRLRGELRRFVQPVVIGAIGFVVIGACLAQSQTSGADPRPPSPMDLTGSLRIALQHHASALGFLLIGIGAGFTTGDDARSGATATALLADHDARRVWARRLLAIVLLVVTSVAVTGLAVHATAHLTACSTPCRPSTRSSGAALLGDAGTAGITIVFTAALGLAIALALRSDLLTVVAMVAIYLVPSNHLGTPVSWVTPTKWISQVMQFEPYGLGSDYTGGQAATDHRGAPAVVAGSLLLLATALLGASGVRSLRRRGAQADHVGT